MQLIEPSQIISFSGKKGSGKSTAADYIARKYGYTKLSFATPLKELCDKLILALADRLYSSDYSIAEWCYKYYKSEALRNKLELAYDHMLQNRADFLSIDEFNKTRHIYQYIGTDVCRAFNETIWVDILVKGIRPNRRYVIDDCRFKNELTIADKSFYIIKSEDSSDAHPSENSLSVSDVDHIITNRGSKQDLYRKVRKLL